MIRRVPYRVGRLVGFACALVLILLHGAVARAAGKRIVFVVPAGTEADAGLKDALTAQLSGSESELVFEHFTPDATTLARQAGEAKALSQKYGPLGVFWLDAPPAAEWLLYLSVPPGDRVLVRRIAVEAGGIVAATEAVAVITSDSANALATGRAIGMEAVQLPPEPTGPPPPPEIDPFAPPKPPPPPPPKPPEPPRTLVSIGYVGDHPAQEIDWQSGARLGVAHRFPRGITLGGGYSLLRASNVRRPDVTFQVSRVPLDVSAGWLMDRRGFRLGFELRAVMELLTRDVVSTATSLQARPSSTRPLFLLSPRVRLEQDLGRSWGLFIDGGVGVALNSFSFVYRADTADAALLRPTRVRPVLEVGALLFL